MFVKVFGLYLAGFLNVVAALITLIRNYKKLSNIFFATAALSIAGWVIGIGVFLSVQSIEEAIIWAKIYYAFPVCISVFLLFFVKTFPGVSKISYRYMALFLVPAIALIFTILFIKSFLTTSVIQQDWGKEVILNSAHYLVYSVFLLITFSLGIFTINRKIRTLSGIYSKQAKAFFVGFTTSAILGVFFNLMLPWFGNYRLIWIGPLFTAIFVLAVFYSIYKHKLFDVRLIIARSLAYLFSLLLLGIGYIFVSFVTTERVLGSAGETTHIAVNLILLALIALTYQPLKRVFDRVTNRIFYRDAYEPQVFLDELNNVLVENIELEKLLAETVEVIERNLKADYTVFSIRETSYFPRRTIGSTGKKLADEQVAEISKLTTHIHEKVIVADYLDDNSKELKRILEKMDVAILVRLVATLEYEVEGVGYILFGPKKSGNPYNKQDIQTLEIIANELVIAIQNGLRFEEIEKFNVTLQEKIDDATRRLKRTNEKLKALDETKDEFISMASHQLRTPLTSVKGYLSMVLEGDAGDLQEMQKKLLGQAFISSQRMVYLIADLLNVSRLRTGKFIIEPTKSNLADVIEGEVGQLTETAKSRELTLTYDKPKDFPELYIDETKIRQVIMNFIDNAIYYTPAGGNIKVELKDMGKTIEYTVTDDGIGVPKEEQHHLFTKFYRAGNAKKARPDGTGLGLFMAKKVVVTQGGSIIFKSQPGKGSTFGFSFEKAKLQTPPEGETVS